MDEACTDSIWSLRVIKINIQECYRPHPGWDYLMCPPVPLKTNEKEECTKKNEAGKFTYGLAQMYRFCIECHLVDQKVV
jgi:hypothetical protein